MSGPTEPTYHRIESPTQTVRTAFSQRHSGEVWGRTPRGGHRPVVQAYLGPLPAGRDGIEFTARVPPGPLAPPGHAEWREPVVPTRWVSGTEYAILGAVRVTRIVHGGVEL